MKSSNPDTIRPSALIGLAGLFALLAVMVLMVSETRVVSYNFDGLAYLPVKVTYLTWGLTAIALLLFAGHIEAYLVRSGVDDPDILKKMKRLQQTVGASHEAMTRHKKIAAGLRNELTELKRQLTPEFQDMKSQANGTVDCPWCGYHIWYIDESPLECPKCREIIGEDNEAKAA